MRLYKQCPRSLECEFHSDDSNSFLCNSVEAGDLDEQLFYDSFMF